MSDYRHLIDTATTGGRYDVTPIFTDYSAFTHLVADLVAPFQDMAIEYVAGIDALGFILGTAVALRLAVGFLPIRKAGKIPVSTYSVSFVDYTRQHKALEIRPGVLPPGSRVLLVDDWIETAAQINAAIQLIHQVHSTVVGITTVHIDANAATHRLRATYPCHMVWDEPTS